MNGLTTKPTPDHYWDSKTMSWKLPGDCSELRGAFCSTKFDNMETALKIIAVWAGQDEFSGQTRKAAMKDIHDKAMNALGNDSSL